jgi:fructokinase
MHRDLLIGGIEAGGTKFICGVADGDGNILEETRIPTGSPADTLGAVTQFFALSIAERGPLSALSVGSFGPLSLNPVAADYGRITSTPKIAWQDVDILGHLGREFSLPMTLDTDVNCAAVGERLFGSGQGLDTFCYVTVGTGIGVGVLIDGAPHGIRLPRAPGDENFPGICPYHGDCLEGLASGPAMNARWGKPAETLPADHPAWDIEADYLAGLCATITYLVRPDRIILGGGVMQSPTTYPQVRGRLVEKLAGYDASMRSLDMDDYIAAPTAGASAGLTGALALAYRTAVRQWPTHWSVAPQSAPTNVETTDA